MGFDEVVNTFAPSTNSPAPPPPPIAPPPPPPPATIRYSTSKSANLKLASPLPIFILVSNVEP